jgi:DNA replication protein DnaD
MFYLLAPSILYRDKLKQLDREIDTTTTTTTTTTTDRENNNNNNNNINDNNNNNNNNTNRGYNNFYSALSIGVLSGNYLSIYLFV